MKKLEKKIIEDIFSLTPMQEGMLFHYLKDPGSDIYFEQLSLEISGEIDFQLFEKAWNFVVETNEMLRTVFRWEKLEKPARLLLKQHRPNLVFIDLTFLKDDMEKQNRLGKIKQEDRQKKFDLQEVPFRVLLCKVSDRDNCMIISNHHILYDGWSTGIILKEFFKFYLMLCKGERWIKPPVKTPIKEFVKWIQNQDRKKQQHFWREYLAGFETPVELPIKRRLEETRREEVESYSIILEEEIRGKLDVFIKNNRVTPAEVFYTAWGILLQRYCDSEDVIFGTTVSGRSAGIKGIGEMVGLFINTLPLRIQSPPGVRIMDVLHGIEHLLREREEYEITPLVDIIDYSSLGGSASLFDTIIAIENYPLDNRLISEGEGSRLSINSYSIVEITHYDLTVGIMPFDELEIKFSFKQELFEKVDIENLAKHFKGIVGNMIENPEAALSRLEIISIEEKNRILYEFNDTAVEYPAHKNIQRLFEEQAEQSPGQVALTGPKLQTTNNKQNGVLRVDVNAIGETQMSYGLLNEESDRLAYTLLEKGVQPDSIVGIMMKRSVEMVIGILAVLKAGGAYLPIDPEYPEERIDYMLKDSNAQALVLAADAINRVPTPQRLSFHPSSLPPFFPSHPSNLAYIIYTSGTTGKPKGVMINHASIVNTLSALERMYPFTRTDVYLLKTSYLFDVSAAELFGWFFGAAGGGRLAILKPGSEKDPRAILESLEKMQVTHVNFVPSMFNVLTDHLDTGNTARLSSLKYIFLAGEVLLPAVVNKFRRLNGVIKLENLYGPTEAAIYASRFRLEEWSGSGDIPIGKPLYNVKLYIFNRGRGIQPVGVPGELAIEGAGLARGYLNQPELTNEKFISISSRYSRPFRPYMTNTSKRLYTTGDLARWQPKGNIEFLGRIDYQVKIRGFRIELGEIENQLLKSKLVKEVVVAARVDKNSEKYLCAYIVPHSTNFTSMEMAETLKSHLHQVIPGYMVPSFFVFLDKIPLTASGKVDRRALPEPGINFSETYAAPRQWLEKQLVDICIEVLFGREALQSLHNGHLPIGIDDDFFRLGGHSLKATSLISKIHKTFNVKMTLTQIFKSPFIRAWAAYIKKAEQYLYQSIHPVEKQEYYPLSSAQKRMFLVHQFKRKDDISDNIAPVMSIEGNPDLERFAGVIHRLIKRQESFRTSFEFIGDEPMQRVHHQVEFKIEYYDIYGTRDEAKVKVEESIKEGRLEEKSPESLQLRIKNCIHSFIRPFDLSRPPLLRMGIIKTGETGHLLMIDMHHIISDGVSAWILIDDFTALYHGTKLPGLKIQYKDFTLWQNQLLESALIKKQETYWCDVFPGHIPVLDMPTSFPRPAVQSFAGDYIEFEMDRELSQKVKSQAWENGATLYIVLLAIYNILLHKYCGQEDIVVGTPIAGRPHSDLDNIIGMFANTLAMRNYPQGNKTFRQFLAEVKINSLKAFDNQDYQFETLVNRLGIERSPDRQPLFDTMLVVQNAGRPGDRKLLELKLDNLVFKNYPIEEKITQFDIITHARENPDTIAFKLRYCTRLFKKEMIETLIRDFLTITREVVSFPGIKISDIKMFAPEEKVKLLADTNKKELDNLEIDFDMEVLE